MEKIKTQRIIGTLVIIGLIIVILPLLFNGNVTAEQVTAKAPPFPAEATTPVKESSSEPALSSTTTAEQQPAASPMQSSDHNIVQVVDNENPKPLVSLDPNSAPQKVIKIAEPTEEGQMVVTEEAAEPQNKPATEVAPAVPIKAPEPVVENIKSIIPKKHMQSAAWAIQLGSFKDKINAQHLSDQLRLAGYKAFTHEVKAPSGATHIRVYIGPLFQQASATKISDAVRSKFNIRGIVVPYNPLAL